MLDTEKNSRKSQAALYTQVFFSHMTVFRWFMLKWSLCGPLKRVSEMVFKIKKILENQARFCMHLLLQKKGGT
jgi:hypothetical protein